MMSRILELPKEVREQYDTSSLKVVAASGSALPGRPGDRVDGRVRRQPLQPLRLDRGGLGVDRDARRHARRARAPPAAPPRGTILKLLDEKGVEVPPGETGRIFVANEMLFEGYTGDDGGSKDVVDGLMSTGDVGRLDEAGRLFVEGRDDEMIVSGGENVFPKEVEDLLARHESVAEAAAVGVEDEKFGQRLRAFVVPVRLEQPLGGRPQGLRQEEPGELQGPARDLVPRRAAAQRHRQGAQARAEGDGGGAA